MDQVKEQNSKGDFFFRLINHSLACIECLEKGVAAKCVHQLKFIPPWKSLLRFTQMKALVWPHDAGSGGVRLTGCATGPSKTSARVRTGSLRYYQGGRRTLLPRTDCRGCLLQKSNCRAARGTHYSVARRGPSISFSIVYGSRGKFNGGVDRVKCDLMQLPSLGPRILQWSSHRLGAKRRRIACMGRCAQTGCKMQGLASESVARCDMLGVQRIVASFVHNIETHPFMGGVPPIIVPIIECNSSEVRTEMGEGCGRRGADPHCVGDRPQYLEHDPGYRCQDCHAVDKRGVLSWRKRWHRGVHQSFEQAGRDHPLLHHAY